MHAGAALAITALATHKVTGLPPLKLIALEPDDLPVVSAHLQDAVVKVGDMTFLPRPKRFAMLVNRFDWAGALAGGTPNKDLRRRRAAVRFERVLGAKVNGFDLKDAARVLSLLAIHFEPGEAPAGTITLIFAGDAGIRLEVECVEAELSDLGGAWRTRRRPVHNDDDGAGGT